jgi:hypothetical protein
MKSHQKYGCGSRNSSGDLWIHKKLEVMEKGEMHQLTLPASQP